MAIVAWLPEGEPPADAHFQPDGETFPSLALAISYIMNRPDRYQDGKLPWIKAEDRIISYDEAREMYVRGASSGDED